MPPVPVIIDGNMKRVFLTLAMITVALSAVMATEQVKDKIIYNGKEYSLATDFLSPSILEYRYAVLGQESPYHAYSTACYRGHIATYEIIDDRLYLKSVESKEEREIDNSSLPDFYDDRSDSDLVVPQGLIWANWFTGPLSFSDDKETYILHVKHGKAGHITAYNTKKLQKALEKGLNKMGKEYEDYLIFYVIKFFLSDSYFTGMQQVKSPIVIESEKTDSKCYIQEKNGFSNLFLKRYKDPLDWKYSWLMCYMTTDSPGDMMSRFGVPECEWRVIDGKLYVSKIAYFRADFWGQVMNDIHAIQSTPVEMSDIFDESEIIHEEGKAYDGMVLAEWVTGPVTVVYYDKAQTSGTWKTQPKEIHKLTFEKGVLTSNEKL